MRVPARHPRPKPNMVRSIAADVTQASGAALIAAHPANKLIGEIFDNRLFHAQCTQTVRRKSDL